MKQTTLAFIIALGLAVPGFAYAANSIDNGNKAYKDAVAAWNGAGVGINAARLTAQQAAQKSHFEYNRIYKRDVAAWNGAGHGSRLAS